MTTTYSVTRSDGREVTRRSDAIYVAASETQAGRVRFHQSDEAARRAAGQFGRVHDISDQAPAAEAPQAAARAYIAPDACGPCAAGIPVKFYGSDGRRHVSPCPRCGSVNPPKN